MTWGWTWLRTRAVLSMQMRSLAVLFGCISAAQELPAGCGSAVSLLQSHECSVSPRLFLAWICHGCNVPQRFCAAQQTPVSKGSSKGEQSHFYRMGPEETVFLLLLINLVKEGSHLEVFKQPWFFFQEAHWEKKKIIVSPKYQNICSAPLTQLNLQSRNHINSTF